MSRRVEITLTIIGLIIAGATLLFGDNVFQQITGYTIVDGVRHFLAGNTTTPLPSNYALQFDGADDFVSLVDSGDFDFDNSFTVEAWVKPLSLAAPNGYKALISGVFSDPPISGGGWTVFLDSRDYSNWGLSVCVPGCEAAFSGSGGLQVSEWQHIAATYNGNKIIIYRNGETIANAIQSGNVTDVNFILLGIWEKSFNGLIDEVRVWNTARTQNQIQTNMNRALSGQEKGLIGYWQLDDGTGQIVVDSTPNHNNGRLGSSSTEDSNDPTWVVLDVPIH